MNDILQTLPLEQKIGQLFFIGVPGPELDQSTTELLEEIRPGGVCLFARNIKSREQTRHLNDGLADLAEVSPLLSLDEEGGLVDRLRRIMEPFPAPSKLRTPADAELAGGLISEILQMLGFNMDFAPVVDVIDQGRSDASNGLYSRTFGNSREDAAEFGSRFVRGLRKNGILGCLKHFPGLAAARVDSHEELPIVEISEAELLEKDLFPYRRLIPAGEADSIMVAHAAFPAANLQEKDQSGKLLPTSLSYRFVTELLRGELSFDGLVITDDLEMGAIKKNYGIGEACKMAILAGVDMLAICAEPANIREGFAAVLGAVKAGDIAEECIDVSLGRIAAARSRITPPPPFDPGTLDRLALEISDLSQKFSLV